MSDFENTCSSGTDDSDADLTPDQIVEKELKKADGNCPPTFLRYSGKNLEWDYFLLKNNNLKYVAPLKFFKHAPLSDATDTFFKLNYTIEVYNPFVKCLKTVNWFAKIVHFAGYRALIKYETFEDTKMRFAWIDFCSDVVKPLGYSNANGILLFPPYDVKRKHPEFYTEIKKRIEGCITVPDDHLKTVQNSIKATQKYKLNDVVEVVNKKFLKENCLARITAVVGDRVHCTYIGPMEEDGGFWLNCRTDSLLHDLGFSHTIGHTLVGVPVSLGEIFDTTKLPQDTNIVIEKGMVLEARHPVLAYRIAFAQVEMVLKFGYFLLRFEANNTCDCCETLFHITSPYIFPCGFSKTHGIILLPPTDEHDFNWERYCRKKGLQCLALEKLPERPSNPFELGMKMEAVDVCRPAYVGPATVTKIVKNLLLLHFDGWTRQNEICFQWIDCQSKDIYPLGWCTMVGHELQSFPEDHNPNDEPGKQRDLPFIVDI